MADFIIPKQFAANKVKLILKSNVNQLIKPVFFNVDKENMAIEQQEYDLQKNDTFSMTNRFGLPVFDALVFPAGAYVDPKTDQKIRRSDVYIDTCLLEVNQPKIIVKTQVQGRNGTVKQYVADDDFAITVTGALVSPHSNVPPRVEMGNLQRLREIPYAIPVASNFLDLFGINSVVVEDVRFNQIEGSRNAIGFTMNLVSDSPFEIQYVKNNAVIERTAFF